MSPNPFLAAELWLLLELLPYSRRFALYKDVTVSCHLSDFRTSTSPLSKLYGAAARLAIQPAVQIHRQSTINKFARENLLVISPSLLRRQGGDSFGTLTQFWRCMPILL